MKHTCPCSWSHTWKTSTMESWVCDIFDIPLDSLGLSPRRKSRQFYMGVCISNILASPRGELEWLFCISLKVAGKPVPLLEFFDPETNHTKPLTLAFPKPPSIHQTDHCTICLSSITHHQAGQDVRGPHKSNHCNRAFSLFYSVATLGQLWIGAYEVKLTRGGGGEGAFLMC